MHVNYRDATRNNLPRAKALGNTLSANLRDEMMNYLSHAKALGNNGIIGRPVVTTRSAHSARNYNDIQYPRPEG